MSAVSDETLDRISKYLKKLNKTQINQIEVDIIPNSNNVKNDRTYKLSNYEKNIIKQRNLKKVLNEDNEYQELKLTAKKRKIPVPKLQKEILQK